MSHTKLCTKIDCFQIESNSYEQKTDSDGSSFLVIYLWVTFKGYKKSSICSKDPDKQVEEVFPIFDMNKL